MYTFSKTEIQQISKQWHDVWKIKSYIYKKLCNLPLEQKCLKTSITLSTKADRAEIEEIQELLDINYKLVMAPQPPIDSLNLDFHVPGYWQLIYLQGDLFKPRFHTSAVIYDDDIYLFGGTFFESRITPLNGTWKINTLTNKCSKVIYKNGPIPTPRSKHTAVVYGHNMYVLGGEGVDVRDDKDLFLALDLQTLNWWVPKYKGTAPRVHGHSASLYNEKMYIFGGEIFEDDWGLVHYSNSLFEYNFDQNTWKEVKTHGSKPPPRSLHAGWIHDNKLYIFGGIYCNFNSLRKTYLEDLYCLNLSSMTWSMLKLSGNYPVGRSEMGVATMGGMAYIFGGTSNLNAFWGEYKKVKEISFYNDLFEYDPENNHFRSVIGNGALPSFRASSCLVESRKTLWCISGYIGLDTHSGFNDMYSLRIFGDNSMPSVKLSQKIKRSSDIQIIGSPQPENKFLTSKVIKRCIKCNQTEDEIGRPLLKCENCGAPYCSRECQIADWAIHQPQCYPDDLEFIVE